MENKKTVVLLVSPVFREIANHPKVSKHLSEKIQTLYRELSEKSTLVTNSTRFPSAGEILEQVNQNQVDFIGCHLSHPISEQTVKIPSVKGISTSTSGYNHIFQESGVLITHTPSILDKTVADFTIAIILANLRNVVSLHNFLWSEQWSTDQKWDLDENLNSTLDNLSLGIIGLGEIGRELVRRIAPWGIKIDYFDIQRNLALENQFQNLKYHENIDDVLRISDVVSLHVPLNSKTMGIIDENRLKLLKPHALLVNTARGPIINFADLIQLLKSREISINLAFDVYEEEPLSPQILQEFKEIQKIQPDLRFVFIPHNASSDADTRAQMSIIILEDLLTMVNSQKLEDLQALRLIPPLRYLLQPLNEQQKEIPEQENHPIEQYRIYHWWNKDLGQ
ncbi:MAG: NAD(P)-dependent oxidoreductase [Promethearchaeota archaeon]